jgi:Asp-tRNA(Asn)/Glu-tRNA(Gln) amidotransferase A subunit family amidase
MRVEEAMHKPIHEVAEAIRTGALSSVELTTAYLDRIAQKDTLQPTRSIRPNPWKLPPGRDALLALCTAFRSRSRTTT